jgi:hypothetical protein
MFCWKIIARHFTSKITRFLAEFLYTEALNIRCRIGLPNIVVAKKDLYVGAAKIRCLNSFLPVCFKLQGLKGDLWRSTVQIFIEMLQEWTKQD